MTENTSTTCSSTVWMSPFRRVGTLVVPYFDDQQRVEVGEERRMSLNNYGRSVLEKYGWKEG